MVIGRIIIKCFQRGHISQKQKRKKKKQHHLQHWWSKWRFRFSFPRTTWFGPSHCYRLHTFNLKRLCFPGPWYLLLTPQKETLIKVLPLKLKKSTGCSFPGSCTLFWMTLSSRPSPLGCRMASLSESFVRTGLRMRSCRSSLTQGLTNPFSDPSTCGGFASSWKGLNAASATTPFFTVGIRTFVEIWRESSF